MPERTAVLYYKLCDAPIRTLCTATILCALAFAATNAQAQTRRGQARATPAQASQARRTSTPAPTQHASPAPPSPSVQSSSPNAAPSPSVPEEDADLVIIANVTAKELRFDVVPNPSVTFPGKPERATEWSAERTNLPPQVQPGVTYRNIGIRLKIVSRFADIERIVAEALGEVPTTDDAPQPSAAPPAVTVNATANATANETASSSVGAPTANAKRSDTAQRSRTRRARRSG
jgi:hypothetical protein